MRTLGLIALAVLCAALGGCATAYHKNGFTGGYVDKQLSESSWHVQFGGNGYATGERVHMFFLYRCAEITLEKGFDYLLITPDKAKAALDVPEAAARPMHAVWRPSEEQAGPQKVYYYTYTITTYSASGKVDMFRAPLTYHVPWAIDARKLKDALQPYMDSNGKSAALDLSKIDKVIGVTHEVIGFPAVEQTRIEQNDKADAGKPQRPVSDIVDGFRDREILLHVLFNGRRKITGGTDGGRIELAFTVSPGGVVLLPRVVSTTFKDYSFAAAVARAVKDFRFKASDVPSAQVASFTVEFTPL